MPFIYKSYSVGPSSSQDEDIIENNINYRVRKYTDGTTIWFLRDEFIIHRENGPAIIYLHGQKVWYYRGQKIECSSQEDFERYLKLKAFW